MYNIYIYIYILSAYIIYIYCVYIVFAARSAAAPARRAPRSRTSYTIRLTKFSQADMLIFYYTNPSTLGWKTAGAVRLLVEISPRLTKLHRMCTRRVLVNPSGRRVLVNRSRSCDSWWRSA